MPARVLGEIASGDAGVVAGHSHHEHASYATLKPANFESTKKLRPESVEEHPPPESRDTSGYISTRWASERYPEKISDKCDPPICIHRPFSITEVGQSASRRTDLQPDVHSTTHKRPTPYPKSAPGMGDLISSRQRRRQWRYSTSFTRATRGQETVPLAELGAILERETGCESGLLRMDDWVTRAESQGMTVLRERPSFHATGKPKLVHLKSKAHSRYRQTTSMDVRVINWPRARY
ncbi:uncharacterized protein GLRG_00453 [Colletotrichum graminicola M1.001]|uniref:Uncharacterized protein n=1 Tax=Colletotrichum graminicola (strain M1.001 / M2 / FGSC 10212) TaxID=645133 RepID=E3Q2K8_COLGM|nr:uncharacterized protein GLRG_00453 [Colletotrichum graminicola M1.001]EFQ25309.1 hypothetical protein GLRG_00453 [Colletotrichum graminicola M1.001]